MNIQDSIQTCFKKYIDFSGRASRSEYWWWFLFTVIVQLICTMINQNLGTLAGLALLLPSLAVLFRRLHDIDKSAWWILIAFIPLIGTIILLIFAVTKGNVGPNRFGLPPL